MKRFFLILAVFASFSFLALESYSASDSSERLVVANVEKVELIELDSRPNMLVPVNKFQVTLSNVQIMHGMDPGIDGKVKVILYADDLFEIKQAGRVALYVQYSGKKDFEVLAWEPIRQFACFSKEVVDKKYEKYYWNDESSDQRKCVFLNGRINILEYDD